MTGHRGTTYNEGHDFQQERIVAGPYQFIRDRFGRWVLPGGATTTYQVIAGMLRRMHLQPRLEMVTVYRAGLASE